MSSGCCCWTPPRVSCSSAGTWTTTGLWRRSWRCLCPVSGCWGACWATRIVPGTCQGPTWHAGAHLGRARATLGICGFWLDGWVHELGAAPHPGQGSGRAWHHCLSVWLGVGLAFCTFKTRASQSFPQWVMAQACLERSKVTAHPMCQLGPGKTVGRCRTGP